MRIRLARSALCALLPLLLLLDLAHAQPRVAGEEAEGVTDPSAVVAEAFRSFEGKLVAGVVIECDTIWCSNADRKRVLLHLAGLRPREPLLADAVGAAWKRLVSTTYFEALTARPVETAKGIFVRFEGVGSVVITDVEIEYATWASRFYPQQFEREIRKRLRMKKGGTFPPDYGGDVEAFVQNQRQQVLQLYVQRGFVGTEVEIHRALRGTDQKEVHIRVRVREGRQPAMGEVLVRGNRAFSYAKVVEFLTTGERFDFWHDFFAIFGIGRYAERRLKDELDKVEAAYREDGYVAARARLEEKVVERGVVYPRVNISEGPHVTVAFEGNDLLPNDDLRAVVTFKESGAFDDTEITSSRAAILQAYQAIARYYAKVEARVENPSDGEVRVVFTVDEGPRVFVREVKLRGAERLSKETVLGAMETKGVAKDGVIGVFGNSVGVMLDARVTNDLIRLRALYHFHGFASVRFRCRGPKEAAPLEVWSDDPVAHRCFTVERDPTDERLVYLYLEVSEGQRSSVRQVDVRLHQGGMDTRQQDALLSLLQNLGFRDEFGNEVRWAGINRRKVDAVVRYLRDHNRGKGFLDVWVVAVCHYEDKPAPDINMDAYDNLADVPDTCRQGALVGERIERLSFALRSGPRTVVDGILLRGNLRTSDDIVREQLVLELGGAFSDQGLSRSTSNLRTLGVFESVRIRRISAVQIGAHQVDTALLVDVEEGTDRYLDGYVGLQIDQSLVEDGEVPVLYELGVTLRDRNFWGRALEVGVGLNHGNRIDTPLDVRGDDATWIAGPFFRDRRLFGTKLDMLIETIMSFDRTSARDEYEQVFQAGVTFGYDFYNLSYPGLWGRGLRGSLKTQYSREERRELETDGEIPRFGDPITSISVQPGLTWDRRDNPLHPTKGWLVALSTEVVFNDQDALPTVTVFPSFKETLALQFVKSFFKKKLIFAPSLRLGAVQTDDLEDDLPSGFTFKAGGDGTALPVRGFADASIESCQGIATRDGDCANARGADFNFDNPDPAAVGEPVGGHAMLVGSFETRFPTFVFDDFWFAVFADVGAVAPTWSEMSTDRLYPSAGAGVRWLLTGQIPLRVDVAFPLRETDIEPQSFDVVFNIFYPL